MIVVVCDSYVPYVCKSNVVSSGVFSHCYVGEIEVQLKLTDFFSEL